MAITTGGMPNCESGSGGEIAETGRFNASTLHSNILSVSHNYSCLAITLCLAN